MIHQRLLHSDVRLLTLTGPGGSGKTRLAVACAERSLQSFPDGVYFVDLAPLNEPHAVMPAVGRVLQAPEPWPNDVSEALMRVIGDRRLLLVLDNFEHVLAAAAEVSRLLAGCRGLKVLVTSRAPTHLRWERESPVPPLALPDPGTTLDADQLEQTAAVALFVERTHAVRPDFRLTAENARAVTQICRRLDGLPLALELAAARSKTLAPGDLLRLLDRGLDILGTGATDAAPRHLTLMATLRWSHDLLRPAERTVFRRLASFAGGWDIEAAEAVCAENDPKLPTLAALDGLVNQSLLQMHETGGHARYRFLDTVRQFAREQLAASGESDEVARRHAAYFLGVAEAVGSEAQVFGPQATTVRALLDAADDDLQAALRWSIDHGEAEQAMRLADALQSLWYIRGPYVETRRVLEQVLAMPGAQAVTARRASLLHAAALAASMSGERVPAQDLNDQALTIARSAKSSFDIAAALQTGANIADLENDLERVQLLGEQALALFRQSGNRFREAVVLTNLGRLAWKQGDLPRARTLAEHALAVAREVGSVWAVNYALLVLGYALRDQNQLPLARTALEEGVALAGSIGDQRIKAFCLDALAHVALRQGRRDEALTRFGESLRLWWEIGEQARVADSLDGHARVAALRGQREQALRLAGAASGLRTRLRVAAPPQVRALSDEWFGEVQRSLGDEHITPLLAVGQAMSTDEAVVYALQAAQPTTAAVTLVSLSPLTAREQDVARLLAGGRSNRQIAVELVVSEATAAKHVENILEKLGLKSRTQIAAWVRDREAAGVTPLS
jgi:predicted ATPase/DNA-binding CsgD family transcriptional regulator